MVISDDNKYGPIGIIFALLSYLTAIGVVVILGAVAGLAWYERSSGQSETGSRSGFVLAGSPCVEPPLSQILLGCL